CGVLLRSSVEHDDVRSLIEQVCDLTGDEEKQMRLRKVEEAIRAHNTGGRNLYGVPKMIEFFGEPAAKEFFAAMGIRKQSAGQSSAPAFSPEPVFFTLEELTLAPPEPKFVID